MIASTIRDVWSHRPRLSLAFWFSFVLLYLIGFVAIAALANPTLDEFLLTADAPQIIAIKLNYVRLPAILVIMLMFPLLLWKSLEMTLWLMRLATASAIVFYIDDHLILYEIIEYPKLVIFKVALFLRPMAIMAMLWITFELHFRLKLGQQT